jgi:cytoskeleton protein RodZ
MAAWHYLVPGQLTLPSLPSLPTASSEAAAPVLAPQARVEPPAETPPVALAAPQPAANVMPPLHSRQLIFEFRGKSWVEVKDASQRIILTGQYVGGSREAVVGEPPFQLVVGNAADVLLQYDEKSIDLKPYTRAEVARLTLE